MIAKGTQRRLATALGVLAFVAGLHGLVPDPREREPLLLLVVLSVGYGHLLGAAVFARHRAALWFPAAASRVLVRSFVAVSLLSLFLGYELVLARWPLAALGLLGIASWHAVENDLVLARAYTAGLRIPPFPRCADLHVLAAGATSALLLFFLAALEAEGGDVVLTQGLFPPALARSVARVAAAASGVWLLLRSRFRRQGVAVLVAAWLVPRELVGEIGFADLFAVVTLYHLVSWLVLSGDRVRESYRTCAPRARRDLVRLAAVHAPALTAGVMVGLGPAVLAEPLRLWLFSPDVYLFWAVLHVGQTLAVRGLE